MEKGDEKLKGKTLSYQPTRAEGTALNYLALALRPEWTPRTKDGKTPGAIWWEETDNGTFPQAENFDHCLAALTDYCKAEKQGKPRWTHPRLFPGEGDHWKKTLPIKSRVKKAPCEDHPENDGGEANCTQCWADIKAGQRPHKYLGKRYENHETAA